MSKIKEYLWNKVTEYHKIPYEEYQVKLLSRTYSRIRKSNRHWDIINHLHFWLAKSDPNWSKKQIENRLADKEVLVDGLHYPSLYQSHRHPWNPNGTQRRRHRFSPINEDRSKYRKKPHHFKKDDEWHQKQQLKRWRQKKSKKKSDQNYYSGGKAKKYFRKLGNKRTRCFVRGRLSKGDYILSRGYRKTFTDPMDWW